MNIQSNFYGQMVILFEPNEIESQINFLLSLDPKSEEESEMVQRMLREVIMRVEYKLGLKPRPKLLTLTVDHHMCENCMMMINTKKDRFRHVTKGGNSVYMHLQCPVDPPPPLKE